MVNSVNSTGSSMGQVPVTEQKELTPEQKARIAMLKADRMSSPEGNASPPPPPPDAAKKLDIQA